MKVKITSDGTSHGTKVTTADGVPVRGVSGIVFRAEVDDVNRAELSLCFVEIEAEAEARVYVGGKQVCRIEYADGSFDKYPAT